MSHNIIWQPNPGKQTEALRRDEFEVLYGGARGGGKTDAGLAWMLRDTDNSRFRGLVLRRNSEDLKDWIDRAYQMYSQLGFTKVGNPPEFRSRQGAVIRTGHLKDAEAYTKYQGHEYHRILIEELTQIPQEKNYLRILSSARSTVPGLFPRIFATTNPGGVGHGWVKARFIDPAPWGTPIMGDNGRTRIFINATVDDNPVLMDNDPMYVQTLEALKDEDPETYRAWRFGDWDVFSGQVFAEFRRSKHVVKSFLPSRSFSSFLWMDWGYSESSAFACYLSAVIPMKTPRGDTYNRVVTYKEWYGNLKDPDEWAEEIYNDCRTIGVRPIAGITDPAMHNTQTDGSTSIAELMEKKWYAMSGQQYWCRLERGSNNRIAGVATMHRWLADGEANIPYWIITANCTELIRTLPLLVYDEHKVEDVDTTQEDHAFDACKYGLSKIRHTSVSTGAVNSQVQKSGRIRRYDKHGLPIAINLDKFKKYQKPKKKYFV